jgi:hypothetical protein
MLILLDFESKLVTDVFCPFKLNNSVSENFLNSKCLRDAGISIKLEVGGRFTFKVGG